MNRYRQITTGSRAYLYFRVGGAALLLLLVLIALGREKGVAKQERKAALERCLEEQAADDCKAQIAANHEECFRYNYQPASKTSPQSFNRAWYYNCVIRGWDEFSKARQKQFRENLQKERQTREIVDDVLQGR